MRQQELHADIFYSDLNIAYIKQGQIAYRKYQCKDQNNNKNTIISGPTFPKNTNWGLKHWLKKSVELLSKYIEESGRPPDIIHAHTYLGGAIAAGINVKYQIPFIITEHYTGWGTGNYKNNHYLLAQDTYKKAHLITSVSQSLQSTLSQRFNIESRVTHNFINFNHFSISSEKSKSNFDIIGVGDLLPRKQWHHIISAFANIRNQLSNARLTIIGEGVSRNSLQKLINELGLTNQIKLVGNKSKSQVAAYMQKSHLLVHPSKVETFGIIIAESLASGTPIISFNNGGIEEFRDLPGVHIVKEMNNQKLGEAILNKFLNKGNNQHTATEIRFGCQTKFSAKTVVPQLMEIYNEALDKHIV